MRKLIAWALAAIVATCVVRVARLPAPVETGPGIPRIELEDRKSVV